MKSTTKLIALILLMGCALSIFSQPQGFSYQAVIRNAEGEPMTDQQVNVRIILQNEEATEQFYTETHTVTTSKLGVITLSVGEGTVESGNFGAIPWEIGNIFMKVEIDPDAGSSYAALGISKLLSVPYSLFSKSSNNIASEPDATDDDPIFVVRNRDGQIVFAVYQAGVRVYVDDTGIKGGTKGGFAVGGLSPAKEGESEYFRVTPDSVRIYIDTTSTKKGGTKGGFAVGGLSPAKGGTEEFLRVTRDSSRIYVNTQAAKGGTKGGFAVGGLSPVKQDESSFMFLTPENYFIGHEAGSKTTTGLYNIFIGYESGYSNTEGYENSFIGHESGWSNTLGYSNVFLGNGTGMENTEGMYNVFLGNYAGSSNTTGFSNVMIGDAAGEHNTTGSSNVLIGDWSGASNTEGEGNIFIGDASGWSNSTGSYNLFMGPTAGYSNTTGEGNVFLGDESGYSSNGSWNVFLGNSTGFSNESGNENIYLGIEAGYSNAFGNENVFIGSGSGYENQNGSNNVFIGSYAGYFEAGSNRLYIENSDADSTDALIFGNFESDVLQVNYSLGVGRYPSDNEFEVEGEASKTVPGSWLANSDLKIFNDVQDIENARDIILKLRPVKFRYADFWISKHPKIQDKYYYNFIAQEYQKVFPESVKGNGEYIEGSCDEILQLDTYNAQIISIKAVQEIIMENENLKERIKILEVKSEGIDQLKAELEVIKALLAK